MSVFRLVLCLAGLVIYVVLRQTGNTSAAASSSHLKPSSSNAHSRWGVSANESLAHERSNPKPAAPLANLHEDKRATGP